jgi:CBS domain-containing protein
MSVESILRTKGREVVTTTADTSVRAAAEELRRRGIASLIVTSMGAIVGIVTEREITSAFAEHGEKLASMNVGEIMRTDVYKVSPADHVTRLMALMTTHRVRHLPVVEGDRLVGVVSIGDAVKSRLDDLEVETRILRDLYVAAR